MKKGKPVFPAGITLNYLFSDTYTVRDYEVVLDCLYGMFTSEQSTKFRIFDPFVQHTKDTPLITPRMLAERLEAFLEDKDTTIAS